MAKAKLDEMGIAAEVGKETIENLRQMAEQGCPMAKARLAELEKEKSGKEDPEVEKLKEMAAQGCPMAKAKLKKLKEGENGETVSGLTIYYYYYYY